MSALVFAWKSGKNIQLDPLVSTPRLCVYGLSGPLFFGSVRKFLDSFDPYKDPDNVVIDFRHSKVCDQSGLEAIKSLSDRYFNMGKRLHLKHLSEECRIFPEKHGSICRCKRYQKATIPHGTRVMNG